MNLYREHPSSINPPAELEWPWVAQSAAISHKVTFPKISIITPNYNGGEFIERTIRSVLLQEYPNLEFIIVDGGSTDDSIEVIKYYERGITWWISEQDGGQSEAINKGFARCTGEIVNWLCSDDILLPDALFKIANSFMSDPDAGVVVGQGRMVFAEEKHEVLVGHIDQESLGMIPANNPISQPACFYRKTLLDRSPALIESYHYAMDFELWAYFRHRGVKWIVLEELLSEAFVTGENKSSTGGQEITEEMILVYETYVEELVPLSFWYRHLRLPAARTLKSYPGFLSYITMRPLQVIAVLLLGPFYGFEKVRKMNFLM
jgi:glycosyltransferase involved in cell wall biosynthesis